MRASILKILVLGCWLCTVSAADEPYPYLVPVKGEGAPLRSGPGEEYYETAQLAAGTAVEVWRSAPGGWLAVRPPRGSFSLVAASDVRVRPDRVAEVVRPDVPALVGSQVVSERDVVQVLLTEGERVQVLETMTLDGQFWHRIAPPSGEFRWIHETQVGGPRRTPEGVAESGQDPPAAPAEEAPPTKAVVAERQPYRIARHSVAAGVGAPPSSARIATETQHAGRTLADVAGSGGTSGGEPSITFAEIELELATIVAEDSSLWRFSHLKGLCHERLSSANTAEGQHEAEALLEKISRFERIRDRKRSLTGRQAPRPEAPTEEMRPRDASVEAEAELPAEEIPPKAVRDAAGGVRDGETGITWRAARGEDHSDEANPLATRGEVVLIPDSPVEPAAEPGRYDGIGTLRPVVSRRREAPRYALVDPDGDVVTFITPSPGVNLQPYVGQRIGVVGTRGYMPEFKRTHVTAARVTPLR